MDSNKTLTQEQQLILELQAKIAAYETKKPTKGIELLVEHETGYVQIRRLTPRSLNLPTWVIRWILSNSKKIVEFMSANTALLTEQSDSDQVISDKQAAREVNLTTENPVVRKPRAKNEPATAGSD